jgi:hypothetical protein
VPLLQALQAAAARVPKGWGLAEHPPNVAGPTAGGRPDRLVAGINRYKLLTRLVMEEKTLAESIRSKACSGHLLIRDAQRDPFATLLTDAFIRDVTKLPPLVEALRPVSVKRGRPRCRPKHVAGCHSYDSEPHRQTLRLTSTAPLTNIWSLPHGSGLGVHLWLVERTFGCISFVACTFALNVLLRFTTPSRRLVVA